MNVASTHTNFSPSIAASTSTTSRDHNIEKELTTVSDKEIAGGTKETLVELKQ